ncbi:MAG: universal stress protein [Chitinophagaceae bacterium]|nr:universal stress protein [Chitinophagaceae bacterium]
MKRILIATDFSPIANNAANYGAHMALAINAAVVLLHVYQLPVPSSEIAIPLSDAELRAEADAGMGRLKTSLLAKTGNKLQIETEVRMGSFFNELNTVCKQVLPYAVILGSQGKTAAERFFFGSQAVYTMKHLTWPVITVPGGASFTDVKRIGLACDFDNVIDSIRVDEIRRLVKDLKAELHVLNTGKESDFNPDLVFESGMLRGMIKDLDPKYHFISNDDIDEGILDFVADNHIDMLIAMPKSHTLVEKLFHKSHTKQFVLHSHVPVMALHL